MIAFEFIAGQSGGLAYHVSALRHRAGLWAPFRERVREWLGQVWRPAARELVIFGSSAGWTLHDDFLAKFDKITIVEPDPVARTLFRHRFRGLAEIETFGTPRILPWFSAAGEWRSFLEKNPRAAVLFSNLIGQIPRVGLQRRPDELSRAEFLAGLEGREWASYHDVFSTTAAPVHGARASFASGNPEDIARACFADGTEVIDHDTRWLPCTHHALWRLRPLQTHVIGFTATGPRRA